eukprot:6294729-Prymnesium_polylepis.1
MAQPPFQVSGESAAMGGLSAVSLGASAPDFLSAASAAPTSAATAAAAAAAMPPAQPFGYAPN